MVAAVLAALSMDDMLSLHEQLELLGDQWSRGALHFAWVLPGAAAGACLVVVLVRAARRLPSTTRTALIGGTGLLLLAALGLEAVGGLVLDVRGDVGVYIVVSHLEELLKSVAAVAFVLAVARGLTWQVRPGGVMVGPVGAGL